MNLQDVVADGALAFALLIALLAGLLSFLSPCVLPLVPGYLAYVSGTADSSGQAGARWRQLAGAALFVAGFTVVLVLFLAAAGTVGVWLLEWQDVVTRVLGALIILMGVVFVGGFGFLQRTARVLPRPRVGLWGAPLLGVGFALGWTPCLGPTLTVIMSLSLQQGSVWRAVLLALAYCVGLGVPFLLMALGFGWLARGTAWFRRHIRAVNIAGGVLLLAIGVLMVTGLWGVLMSDFQAVINGYVTPL